MSLNIRIVIPSTVKTLEADLKAIQVTLAKFPDLQGIVSAAPAPIRAAMPVKANLMRSSEENQLREQYRAKHPLGKGFRMTHFLTHKYKGNALEALRGWKAGAWTLQQAGEGEGDSQAGGNDVGDDASEY